MTVPRVGIDLVPLARARQLVEPNHRAILERMLRSEEIDECTRSGVLDASAVAGRLAVKEAVFKLLRTREPVVPWHGIAVRATPGTWPEVHLSGHAAELARHARLITPVAVSVAHDGDYAVGVATALAVHNDQAPTTASDTDHPREEHPHVPVDHSSTHERQEVGLVQAP
ncbi:MAG: holo-ACP synthase [Pseudonocardiaceae bacterium]